jgi:hypothetical protein
MGDKRIQGPTASILGEERTKGPTASILGKKEGIRQSQHFKTRQEKEVTQSINMEKTRGPYKHLYK